MNGIFFNRRNKDLYLSPRPNPRGALAEGRSARDELAGVRWAACECGQQRRPEKFLGAAFSFSHRNRRGALTKRYATIALAHGQRERGPRDH